MIKHRINNMKERVKQFRATYSLNKNLIFTTLTFLVMLGLGSCGAKKQEAKGYRAGIPQVPTITIETRDITTFNTYPTNIKGVINSEVRPKIAGYITDVLVDAGEKVYKGETLFRLETASLSQQAQAAKANINAAQVQVDQLKPLVKRNIVSESQLATAKAKLQQAKSSYQSIAAQIGYANIKSPINGYVGMIRIREGNLISPSSPMPLTTVSDMSKVYAYFSMNESDYLDLITTVGGETRAEIVKNLPEISLILANGEPYPIQGTVDAINSQVNPITGTVTFRAVFKNPKGILTNGSTGIIKIPQTYEDVPVVPQESTYEIQGLVHVLQIRKSGDSTIAVSDVINTRGNVRGLYIVESGIEEGDVIVARGVNTLPSGSLVKPSPIPFDSVAQPLPVLF